MKNLEKYFTMHDMPEPEPEHMGLKPRKFRFDYAWPSHKVALEIEGNIFSAYAGHRSVTGMLRDIDKYSLAASHGWLIIRALPDIISKKYPHLNVLSAETITRLKRALNIREQGGQNE